MFHCFQYLFNCSSSEFFQLVFAKLGLFNFNFISFSQFSQFVQTSFVEKWRPTLTKKTKRSGITFATTPTKSRTQIPIWRFSKSSNGEPDQQDRLSVCRWGTKRNNHWNRINSFHRFKTTLSGQLCWKFDEPTRKRLAERFNLYYSGCETRRFSRRLQADGTPIPIGRRPSSGRSQQVDDENEVEDVDIPHPPSPVPDVLPNEERDLENQEKSVFTKNSSEIIIFSALTTQKTWMKIEFRKISKQMLQMQSKLIEKHMICKFPASRLQTTQEIPAYWSFWWRSKSFCFSKRKKIILFQQFSERPRTGYSDDRIWDSGGGDRGRADEGSLPSDQCQISDTGVNYWFVWLKYAFQHIFPIDELKRVVDAALRMFDRTEWSFFKLNFQFSN